MMEELNEINAELTVKHLPARRPERFLLYCSELATRIKQTYPVTEDRFCELMDSCLAGLTTRPQTRENNGYKAISNKKIFLEVYF